LGTWLSPVPLPELGSFFRLRVGPLFPPAPPPTAGGSLLATSTSTARATSVTPVETIRVANGTIQVQIKTEPGHDYRVSLGTFDGEEKQVRNVMASAEVTTVQFPDQGLPNPCYVKALRF
jgi:hypothetical protein